MTVDSILPPGKIVTVTGPIEPSELGQTMIHEHIFVDLQPWWRAPEPRFSYREVAIQAPVSMNILGILRRDPYANKTNLILDEPDVAIEELLRYRRAGGGSIVEVTSVGLGGRRQALPEVANASGIRIVSAIGLYKENALPKDLAQAPEEEIYEMLKRMILGVEDGIPAGALGEMGTSASVTGTEARNLTVAASLALELGLSLHVHLEPGHREGPRVLEIVAQTGLPFDRLVLGHIDYDPRPDTGYVAELADSGAYLGFDTFGNEGTLDWPELVEPRDVDRIKLLLEILEQRPDSRIVISHDVATKTSLRRYGGFGYDHVLLDVVPHLLRRGVSESMLDSMLVLGPTRLLVVGRGLIDDSR